MEQPAPLTPTPSQPPAPHLDLTNTADNPLHVMSQGEQVLGSIKRHPIGLAGIYLVSGMLLVLLFVGIGFLPSLLPELSSTDKTYAFVTALLLASLIAVFAWIAVIVYSGNRWVITSDSITQIQQISLFNKQSSQLSLEKLEDVTYEQKSIIQILFNYGTLKVETAGEHSKFQFPYCPNPKRYAVQIIQAHEHFMHENEWLHNTKRSTAFPGPPMTPEQMPPPSEPYV